MKEIEINLYKLIIDYYYLEIPFNILSIILGINGEILNLLKVKHFKVKHLLDSAHLDTLVLGLFKGWL